MIQFTQEELRIIVNALEASLYAATEDLFTVARNRPEIGFDTFCEKYKAECFVVENLKQAILAKLN